MKKESRLAYLLRNDLDLAVDELNKSVVEDYSYVLNQINKFEKVMKNNKIFFNDSIYLDIRNSLIKSFKRFCSYMESCCSQKVDGVNHYVPKNSVVDFGSDIFQARKDLNKEYWKIVRDISDFDFFADKLGIDIFSKDYISKRNDLDRSFEKYYNLVDLRFRSNDF
ncbi:MAG: hypothetical protein JXA16_09090 [Bacteroidales bacterium]|nr:hypothetical protein [Bacteroidales bacterium]